MHRTALSRTQRRTRTRSCRTGALKNRLSWNWSTRRRTAGGGTIRNGLSRLNRRGLIHRTWSGLRNDHARPRRLRTSRGCGRRRCRWTLWLDRRRGWRTRGHGGSRSIDLRRRCYGASGCGPRRYGRRNRGWSLRRHNWSYRRSHRTGRRGNRRRSNNSGRNRSWRSRRRGSWLRGDRSRDGGRFGLLHRRDSGFRRRS
jgi:hypothetical protein